MAVKGPPPLAHLWQSPESIRNCDIVQFEPIQEAPLWCFVRAIGLRLWSVLTVQHPSHRLPGNRALRNHRPDASLATGPFTGGCQAPRGGGLLRACPKARLKSPPRAGFLPVQRFRSETYSGTRRCVQPFPPEDQRARMRPPRRLRIRGQAACAEAWSLPKTLSSQPRTIH